MSRPLCSSWLEFLTKLAKAAGVPLPSCLNGQQTPETAVLYRLADMTVSALRPLTRDQRCQKYRDALRSNPERDHSIPPQTKVLGEIYWPIVLTTNYDDLYWSATRSGNRPIVLGRDREDCHRMLRALDESCPPLLWALQGFLAGQFADPEKIIPDRGHRDELIDQLVVGHQQYQRAINEAGHFRRSFAEVFRRRSLLFLGSGILEDYLVNLFSEIIHHHGPGPYPHFALINVRERERFDPWFLQTRLGIVPVFYKDHSAIPTFLNDLANIVKYFPGDSNSHVRCCSTAQLERVGFMVVASDSCAVRVNLINGPLPVPCAREECSVVSVGRWENQPLGGKQTQSHLSAARAAGILANPAVTWLPLDEEPSYCFRLAEASVFAIAARRRDLKGRKHDRRDLGIIPEAVSTGLSSIDAAGFTVVHMGVIASGRERPWHPIHPFAQTLRGISQYLRRSRPCRIRGINLYIIDPSVWNPVVSGVIGIDSRL